MIRVAGPASRAISALEPTASDAIPADRHRLGDPESRVDRDHLGVADDEVGRDGLVGEARIDPRMQA